MKKLISALSAIALAGSVLFSALPALATFQPVSCSASKVPTFTNGNPNTYVSFYSATIGYRGDKGLVQVDNGNGTLDITVCNNALQPVNFSSVVNGDPTRPGVNYPVWW